MLKLYWRKEEGQGAKFSAELLLNKHNKGSED
jgi:hypothetical protein